MSEHPITPPPELMQQWRNAAPPLGLNREHWIATQAARWGADQELEACISAVLNHPGFEQPELFVELLRATRRPKPPSLAENVSKALDFLPGPGADISYLRNWADKEAYGLRCAVRRALKRLQELENNA